MPTKDEARACWRCGCEVMVAEDFEGGAICAKCNDAIDRTDTPSDAIPLPGKMTDAQVRKADAAWKNLDERDKKLEADVLRTLRCASLSLLGGVLAVLFVVLVFWMRHRS